MLWRISTMNLQLYSPIKSGYGYIELRLQFSHITLFYKQKGLSTVLTVGWLHDISDEFEFIEYQFIRVLEARRMVCWIYYGMYTYSSQPADAMWIHVNFLIILWRSL